jgi:hypothetical protein
MASSLRETISKSTDQTQREVKADPHDHSHFTLRWPRIITLKESVRRPSMEPNEVGFAHNTNNIAKQPGNMQNTSLQLQCGNDSMNMLGTFVYAARAETAKHHISQNMRLASRY